ncbi:MAG TPA: UvrD-helicase domain-containing protein, partial [Woeseiaceae bacterium]|nr:UvrD-helicase domain-containing protein [Woeseiaceae bacterium]
MATEQERLRADDLRARDAALDIHRSFIVQAPAGSGKTELLIQRYLKLFAVVDEPEEILAITFTRKAAAEMRLRVLEALEAAQAGTTSDSPHRRVTADAAADVLRRDAVCGWGIVENPGRMRIMTLDALNASVARMLPLTAGTGAHATIVEDSQMLSLHRDAAAATLDWLAADDDNAQAVRDVLAHVDGHTGIYVEQLARLLASRDQWLPFVGSGRLSDADAARLRASLERELADIAARALAGVQHSLPRWLAGSLPPLAAYAAANLRQADPGFALLADGAPLTGAAAGDLARWLAIATLLLTAEGSPRRRLSVLEGFPPADGGEKAAMQGVLDQLGEHPEFVAALHALRDLPPTRYPDDQWATLRSLFRLLPVGIYELRRLFAARGVTDYVEVALGAAAALGTTDAPGNVALLLDYTVRHVLVDEMQDTSKSQYRLLEALTAGWEPGDGRTLFCVGDPMQSIYRFRNAEVMQFLRAREHGIGGVRLEPLVLRQNFRSGERLVDWFNATFANVLPLRDDPLAGAVAYAASTPTPALAGQGECTVYPCFGSGVEREAEEGAAVVAKLVAAHPGESIAVLVRSRTQLPNLLRQLRARRVACQSVDIDRLTDLPEILDLLALTRALVHPGDRVAWLGLLRSPWIGLD